MKVNYLKWIVEFVVYVIIIPVIISTNICNYYLLIPILIAVYIKWREFIGIENKMNDIIKAQLYLIVQFMEKQGFKNIRCTFHKIKSGKFYQVIDYIPSGTGSGRVFSVAKGIIGKSFRNKEAFVENFKDNEDYRKRMVTDYCYNDVEIQKRSMDRRSYFCYPLLDESHNILGLVYFDSDVKDTFPSLEDGRVKLLIDFLEKMKDSIIQ